MIGRLGLTARERAIVACALLGFALVTADVCVGGYLTHLDGQVREAIQPRSTSGGWVLGTVAELGDVRYAIPILLVVVIVASQYAWRTWPAVFGCATFAVVEAVVYAAKAAVGRPGPGVWADRTGYPGYFPSGHAATSTALVATAAFLAVRLGVVGRVAPRTSEACVALGAAVGALVGVNAVLADMHWASDVVGGLLVAPAILLPAMALCRRYLDGDLPERERAAAEAVDPDAGAKPPR